MKIGVKLHDHRSKGRIDTYHIKKCPYNADYYQACRILQTIQQYNHRASHQCLLHLATFITQSWESNPSQQLIDDILQFMNHLLDTTGLSPMPLNDSLRQLCANKSPIPTVSPTLTLLFAASYIERLKQYCGNIKGSNGCSRRLLLVAFIIAAKYIQSNLRFIVDTSLPTVSDIMNDNDNSTSVTGSDSQQDPIHSDQLPSTVLPMSPPVSPKQPELTDPTQYHYFHNNTTSVTATPMTTKENKDKTNTYSLPSQSSSGKFKTSFASLCSQFNYRIWRMENEFLHFLNNDISVPDSLRLAAWADQMALPPLIPDL
ncbi:uncharacterized protein BX664DRAFT_338339 [Halteromyces radiatus]|uniref:uncharacterized protein n=1 Tax=Halteromyces radiatus TaxID=101107 RepID=UPI00221ECBD7|nr:uncharacterized protein BX664DRAFT_338339 [Halteromyces radiatus]KAI8085015.1 hypothetical protein BX664DRAFT_338339 [Halteromyces radiatus]